MDYTFGDPNYPQNVGTPITSPVLPDVSSFKSDQSTGNFLTDLTNLLPGQDVMKKFKPTAPTTSDYLSAAALGVGGIGSLLFPGFFSSQENLQGIGVPYPCMTLFAHKSLTRLTPTDDLGVEGNDTFLMCSSCQKERGWHRSNELQPKRKG